MESLSGSQAAPLRERFSLLAGPAQEGKPFPSIHKKRLPEQTIKVPSLFSSNFLENGSKKSLLFQNHKFQKIKNQGKVKSVLSSLFYCPIVEYSLGTNLEKSILYPNNLTTFYPIQNTNLFKSNVNNVYNKNFLGKKNSEAFARLLFKKEAAPILGSLNHFLDFRPKYRINKEVFSYKTEFESFSNNEISSLATTSFINTYTYCSFEGEFIFKSLKVLKRNSMTSEKNTLSSLQNENKKIVNHEINPNFTGGEASKPFKNIQVKETLNNLENALFANKRLADSCMILTKKDQISYYLKNHLPTNSLSFRRLSNNFFTDDHGNAVSKSHLNKTTSLEQFTYNLNYKDIYFSLENLKKKNQYLINDTIIKFLNVLDSNNSSFTNNQNSTSMVSTIPIPDPISSEMIKEKSYNDDFYELNFKLNKLPIGMSQQRSRLLLGEFLVYGDQISPNLAVTKPGQIIHINNNKITMRLGQPIFVSPKAILHKYDTDFIEEQSPVITLSYQQLKTGDIIQGIPKVEQFFEARTTKRGRLFRDSLSNLLKGLYKRYCSKGQPIDQAVRQSFYKIQQIIVDGVQRVYRSQGVSIADKHLEVIVKQMTSKVRIIEGGQTGFFPGEIVDLNLVEEVNNLLMRKITYEPLVLGITKASLEVDSFLSAASFQQTTKVLSNAAISKKKDFLKGLKENVILGNLIPAGTGYLVYLNK